MRTWLVARRRAPRLPRLLRRAGQYPPFASLVDLSGPEFGKPGDDMAERVRAGCARLGEPVPEDDEALVRCVVDSMALATTGALEEAQRLAAQDVSALHVVGGGAANDLYLADLSAASSLPVVAGPVEASAIGNHFMQLREAGLAGEREEMRAMLAASFPTKKITRDTALAEKAKRARRRIGAATFAI